MRTVASAVSSAGSRSRKKAVVDITGTAYASRARRSAAMTRSALDDVPGLGPARQAALLKEFGSVKRLRAATAERIASVRGIGPTLAATILTHLNPVPEDPPGTADEHNR